MPATSLDQVVNLAKRRGFIVQSSEIYGGAAAAYDYGPLGFTLKENLKRLWWTEMTVAHENIVGLDSAIFMHPRVWEASGHVESFTDRLIECRSCHRRFKEEAAGNNRQQAGGAEAPCPACGQRGTLADPRAFNLMFQTHLGPTAEAGSTVYLRPETAQGIYVDAPYIQEVMRLKLPFGIAQIGKAFRNEITTGPFIFRTVEFEQAEMQFFVRPDEASRWFAAWRDERFRWYREVLGFPAAALRLHPHAKQELAHYAREAADVQVDFPKPIGWQEVEGIHNRGDWDVRRHAEYSGKDLTIFDDEKQEKVLPWIVETSAGIDRILLALLAHAYTEETVQEPGAAGRGVGERRVVLKLPKALAPVQVAVFPLLSNNEQLVARAGDIASNLRGKSSPFSVLRYPFRVMYDAAGAVGRRYRRQDEIGTPYCVTVDHRTLEDDTVTVRERDSMKQVRVNVGELSAWLTEHFA